MKENRLRVSNRDIQVKGKPVSKRPYDVGLDRARIDKIIGYHKTPRGWLEIQQGLMEISQQTEAEVIKHIEIDGKIGGRRPY